VGLCTAACIAIRASLFRQIGGFDEDFFLNSEDIDLCDRIRKTGHEVHVLPRIWAYHGNSRLQSRDLGRFVFHRLQGKAVYLRKRYHGLRRVVATIFFLEQVVLRLFAGYLILRGSHRTRLSGYRKALALIPGILRA
jgi:GT2 family glycosyltransferase